MKFKLRRFKALFLAGVMSVTLGKEAKAVVLEEETLNKDKMFLSGEETLNKDKYLLRGEEITKEEIAKIVANFYGNVYPSVKSEIEKEKEIEQIAEIAASFYLNVYACIEEKLEKEEVLRESVMAAVNFYQFIYPTLQSQIQDNYNPPTTDNESEIYLSYVAHNNEDEFKLTRNKGL